MLEGIKNFFINDEDDYEEEGESEPMTTSEQKKPQATKMKSGGLVNEIKVIKPDSFNDVRIAAKDLRLNYPVIINLTDLDNNSLGRTLDFLDGVLFTLDGDIMSISAKTYLLTPKSTSISSSFTDNNAYLSKEGDFATAKKDTRQAANKNTAQPMRPTGSQNTVVQSQPITLK